MTLQELIDRLRAADPALVVPMGFANPHSYRGDYYDLAFEPTPNVTVAAMLASAEGAMGQTFEGWKGGDFTMREHTDVYLANEGEAGEGIGPVLLSYMLGALPTPTEPTDA